jgi:sugar phosphate isomerase/epimerase
MTEPRFRRWGFLAALDYETWPAETVARTLAGQGYRTVEWTLAHFDPRRMGGVELDGVVATTRRAGLEVSEMVVQQDLLHRDPAVVRTRVDLTVEVARAAARNGVGIVNVLTGPTRWEADHVAAGTDMPEGEAWAIVLDAMERMLDGVAEAGAVAALEPCWGGLSRDFHTTGVVLRRFGGHPAFAINFDPSHLALARDDIPFAIREFGSLIRHVHIKDVAGTPGRDGAEFIFPLIGEGLVPWPEMFAALDAIGYRGVMSVEFESYRYYRAILGSDPARASALSMEQLVALEHVMPEGLFS